ncbi:MAG: TrmH family RNA methyltransferase [Spirochaetaceae bacterium]|nr:MAG: TrmH family RNA methyltransferase [Spirochaetaceae bacterium]
MTGPRMAPRRLATLGPRALHRLMGSLFSLQPGGPPLLQCDRLYFAQVLAAIQGNPRHADDLRDAARCVLEADDAARESAFVRLQNVLDRHARAEARGVSAPAAPAAAAPSAGAPSASPSTAAPVAAAPQRTDPVLPVVLYLDNIRSPFNTGNIIRSAAAFGIVGVMVNEGCPALDHPQLLRAAMGSTGMIECGRGSLGDARRMLEASLPSLSVPVSVPAAVPVPAAGAASSSSTVGTSLYALETGGTALEEVSLALPALVILGHEELGVSAPLLEEARRAGGVVSIRHGGAKESLNVGVAAGILLHHLELALRAASGY